MEINVFSSSPVSPGAQRGGNGARLLLEHHLLGARNGALPGHAATSSVKIPHHFNSLTTALCKWGWSFITAGAVAAQGLPASVGFQHKDPPVVFLLLRCWKNHCLRQTLWPDHNPPALCYNNHRERHSDLPNLNRVLYFNFSFEGCSQ